MYKYPEFYLKSYNNTHLYSFNTLFHIYSPFEKEQRLNPIHGHRSQTKIPAHHKGNDPIETLMTPIQPSVIAQ